MKKYSVSKTIALSIGVLTMSLLISFMVLAWTPPSSPPAGGNVLSPINISGTGQFKQYIDATNKGWLGVATDGYDLSYGLTVGNVGNLLGIKSSGDSLFEGDLAVSGDLTVGLGTGKLTVGTIDPIFEIGGEKYATYVVDFAGGVRMETSGIVKLENGKYVIDFDKLEKGSDLWLFWQTSNKSIDDIVVLLTPSFEEAIWYEKEGNVLVIYGDRQGEVSYRLSAPRVDFEKWGNLAEDETLEGIKISD